MKIAILAITDQGKRTAQTIQSCLPGSSIAVPSQGVKNCLEELWERYDGIICIMAAGIVVRCIAGLCKSKFVDPAIVVVDEQCRFAISLLSGHLGGANRIAQQLEAGCDLQAVITTGSDVSEKTAVDLWAVENNLAITNPEKLPSVSTRLLNQGTIPVYQDNRYLTDFPDDFTISTKSDIAEVVISIQNRNCENCLHLVPRILYIGFGCRRGAQVSEFQSALEDIVAQDNLSLLAVAGIASVDLKNDEEGLLEIAQKYNWPVKFFTKAQINGMYPSVKENKIYQKAGVYGVAEPAAILAAAEGDHPGRLLIGKRKWERITAAVAARASSMLLEPAPGHLTI